MPGIYASWIGLAMAAVLDCGVGAAVASDGDARRGERQFQRCYSCHTAEPGESARLQGPSLAGVVGRRAAADATFDYSPALRARGVAGLVWSPDALDGLMTDPEAFVPGIRMATPGLADPRDRADIIAYLKAKAAAGR